MQRLIVSLVAASGLVALLGAADPAAAALATFVSGDGSDSNTCSSPADACRTISFALTQTDEGGIVHVLPGNYDPFAVDDKAVEIVADAGQASIFSDNTIRDAGIAIGASGTRVVRIRGFLVRASHGIWIDGSGGTVHIENCTLLPLANHSGIAYSPTGTSELYVSDTMVNRSSSSINGILIKPIGSASTRVVLDNVAVNDNDGAGIIVDGRNTSGSNSVLITNSVMSGNTQFGLFAIDSGNTGATNVSVEGTRITSNAQQGIIANGANVTVRVRGSFITANRVGLAISNGGKIISHGDNVNAGNTDGQGAFTQTLPPQ